MDEIVELFNQEDKDTWLYKFADYFLTDEQKESLVINLLTSFFMRLGHFKWIRENIMENNMLEKLSSNTHRLIVVFATNGKVEGIIYKKKGGFLKTWRRLHLPDDMWKIINRTPDNRKETRKNIIKVLNMKAFW